MQCPYCFTEAHPEASRCPHCRSEIGVFRPLLGRLEALEARVQDLQATLMASSSAASAAATHPPEPSAPKTLPANTHLGHLLAWCGVTLGALGLLHYLLLFVLDANPLLLRLITLSLPAVTAFGAVRSSSAGLAQFVAAGAVVAILSVAAMLGVTALIDKVPFWPQTPRDLRETVEYATGITLAFVGGGLAAGSWRRSGLRFGSNEAGGSGTGQGASPSPVRARLARSWSLLTRIASAVAPVATCATAFYTGLKNFLTV